LHVQAFIGLDELSFKRRAVVLMLFHAGSAKLGLSMLAMPKVSKHCIRSGYPPDISAKESGSLSRVVQVARA